MNEMILALPDGTRLRVVGNHHGEYPSIQIFLDKGERSELICFAEYNPGKYAWGPTSPIRRTQPTTNLIKMENSIMSRNDIKTIMLTWPEVSEAISACVYAELGRPIICEAQFLDDTYWSVLLKNYRVSPAEIYPFLSQTGFPIADWQDTLSDEGGPVTEFGFLFSEHLLSQQLKLTWTHRIIAEDGLWLVDVHSTEGQEVGNGQ